MSWKSSDLDRFELSRFQPPPPAPPAWFELACELQRQARDAEREAVEAINQHEEEEDR